MTSVTQFRNVSKRYGEITAARNLNLDVASGEFLSFLGPSGCGKTTSLRMIAGFEQPSEGEVYLEGACVNNVPAYNRPVNMVFQHYALFPHLNVENNVAYGLKQQSPKPTKREIDHRVHQVLELVRLSGYGLRHTWELSGGQQQRVALARALINKPKVLLLDEPLAALDRKLRREMQIELQNLQRNVGITFILVTHDQEEALSMSDRVCIMREGEIAQIGSPLDLYDRPHTRYVADFVGKSNFFDGVVEQVDTRQIEIRLKCGIAVSLNNSKSVHPHKSGDKVCISVRPEQLVLTRDETSIPEDSVIKSRARIVNRIFLGEQVEYLLHDERLGNFLALSFRHNELNQIPFETNEVVFVGWSRDATLILADDE
ncbi:MAG TPA: ABC transporter ATP-binding protein [Gammaproteobacteria bacterium]|jgi:spermidine/putrescine transport system ATP-binding protein|nr:ABC transporter ATP-binding protein [Gammaproteobacteria bacterium]HIM04413.1 ABC transporter ATP-binding protein [Gammaproteobacteria bacterium]